MNKYLQILQPLFLYLSHIQTSIEATNESITEQGFVMKVLSKLICTLSQ
jgi:hypothetical protein